MTCKPAFAQLPLLEEPAVTSWLPDELLFSLASRFHSISGDPLASSTCLKLFGHARRGSQHDLPCRIDEFVFRTSGMFGSAEEIIYRHTLLPFYLPFRAPTDATDAIEAMRGDMIGSLKYRLGLLTSRFRAHHPLRACPVCMLKDRDEFGVAYWHLSHQYPGVWVCIHHFACLKEARVKANGVGRFLWHLPEEESLLPTVQDEASESLLDLLRRLAIASRALATLSVGFTFDVERLVELYACELKERGMTTANGRIRLEEAGNDFLKVVLPLRLVPEFATLPITVEASKQQLGRLLRMPRTGTHPLRHLLVIIWLFGTWDAFWEKYLSRDADFQPLANIDDTGLIGAIPGSSDLDQEELVRLVTAEGYSVTKAARTLGIDVMTAMAWAAKAGINTVRRPKILKPGIRERLIKDLKCGEDKETVAKRYGISVQTITTTLRTEPGLQQAWHDARFEIARVKARHDWSEAASLNPTLGIKAIRLIEPAAYAWLYRNDRQWLRYSLSQLPKIPRSNHARIEWDQRDQALAQSVRETRLRILSQAGNRKLVTLQQLYQHLPELRAKLSRLERLPLTRQAIEEAIRRKPDGGSLPLPFPE